MNRSKHSRGFTLMELMIVVVIIGILMSIAIPAYNDYVISAKLTEGTSRLSTMRTKLEQFYQDRRTYVGACDVGTGVVPEAGDLFSFSCSNLNINTYTAEATGRNSMAGFGFTISETGAKTSSATLSGWNNGASCWITKRGASC